MSLFNAGSIVTPLERVTLGVPMIDTNHAQIHAANGFSVFVRIASLSNNASLNYALTVPPGAYVHFQVAELSGDGSADLNLYYGATLTKTAAVMTPQNRHQLVGAASVLTFSTVSAVADVGTQYEGASLFGGNQRASAGTTADGNEWVLVSGEHLIRVTSRATTFNGILRLFWYEESDA